MLDTITVQHIDGEGKPHEGIIICNHAIANDLRQIFAELYRQKYPIERIRPISEYYNDDERSMRANNTSCYCYRPIAGSTRLSKHALGMAIDINPQSLRPTPQERNTKGAANYGHTLCSAE